jgi:hypothetical protein
MAGKTKDMATIADLDSILDDIGIERGAARNKAKDSRKRCSGYGEFIFRWICGCLDAQIGPSLKKARPFKAWPFSLLGQPGGIGSPEELRIVFRCHIVITD